MALLFTEDREKVTKKEISIPLNAKKVFKAMAKLYDPYIKQNVKGSKIIKSLASDKQYNKKDGKATKSNGTNKGTDTVGVDDAKIRLHRQEKLPPNSVEYQLYGGELAHNILKNGIQAARGTKEVEMVKPPKPTSNAVKAPKITKSKELSLPNGSISYTVTTESLIRESDDDWCKYYDYVSEYGVNYILGEYFNTNHGDKMNWIRINPSMYKQALSEFTKYGHFVKFPTKYIFQWMGIILKNTAILRACTELSGHEMGFPYDEVSSFAEEKGVELEDDFESCSDWLDESGLYDWMMLPDGTDAMSDYGLRPLEEICCEYGDGGKSAEQTIVLINRALDICHMRGDLSSAFIEGGRHALSQISEAVKNRKKTIYINEKQIIRLRKNGK